MKKAIKEDRNATLEKEATELQAAFDQDTFQGYSLLKETVFPLHGIVHKICNAAF